MPPLSPADRFRAWLVTGPLGRGAAFIGDLAVLVARSVRGRRPDGWGR